MDVDGTSEEDFVEWCEREVLACSKRIHGYGIENENQGELANPVYVVGRWLPLYHHATAVLQSNSAHIM